MYKYVAIVMRAHGYGTCSAAITSMYSGPWHPVDEHDCVWYVYFLCFVVFLFFFFVCFFFVWFFFFFFLNDPAPTEIYTLSLHDALPI